MFSFKYIWKVVFLFARYPSSIAKIPYGHAVVYHYIENSRAERYVRRPILFRNATGVGMYLNKSDSLGSASIALDGFYYELAITELFSKLLRKGMVVIDVGANVGWYTLIAARNVGSRGSIIAFEPDPVNFDLLRKSTLLNNFVNVQLVKKAVSNIEGPRQLYLDAGNSLKHSLSRKSENPFQVESTTLDSILPYSLSKIGILKIDVEGAEPEAIEGSKKTLPKVDHMIMEWNRVSWVEKTELLNDLFEQFSVYRIIPSPLLLRQISPSDIWTIPPLTDLYLRRRDSWA